MGTGALVSAQPPAEAAPMLGEGVLSPPRPRHGRLLRSAALVVGGFGANMVLRLVGNLILTRLLFPEAFGLMTIVQTVLVGAFLLSDAGVEPCLVHSERGNDPAFVNSAWTLQVLRGAVIWLAICALAHPLSQFYREPALAALLPVAGSAALFAGLASTRIALADRHLSQGKATALEVGSYFLQLLITVVLTWIDRSVWALVIGHVLGTAVRTVLSHVWLDGIPNRFAWDVSALGALKHFGIWVFLSSALTFLAGEGNRLVLGRLLDVRLLGFLSIAMALDQLPRQVVLQIGARVLFPAYAEALREQRPGFRRLVLNSRLVQLLPSWLLCLGFAFAGERLMQLLYDSRYHEAGWMLRLLALGSLAGVIGASYNGILWARGLVRMNTLLLSVQVGLQIPLMIIGAHLGGERGLVLGMAAASWLAYGCHAIVYARLSFWQPRTDLPLLALSALATAWVLATPGFIPSP